MASIKVSSSDVVNACYRYALECESGTSLINLNSNDYHRITNIRKMAKYVEDTNFPYIILSDYEFAILDKFLNP